MFDMQNMGVVGAQYKVVNSTPSPFALSPSKLVGTNPQRVCIMFMDIQNTLDIGDSSMAYGAKAFVRISVTTGPITFTFRDYGPLVQGEWWGQLISGSGPIYVTEIIYSPSG